METREIARFAGLLAGCLLALSATSCSKGSPETSLKVAGGGAGFLLAVESPKEGGQQAMVEAVKRRLAAEGAASAEVHAEGTDRIVVLLPGVDDLASQHVEQLLTLPNHLAIAEVDGGAAFFAEQKPRLPSDGSIWAGSDISDTESGASRHWFLHANRREALEAFLKTLTPPAGRRLAVLPSGSGALAYLLIDPPALDNPLLQQVRIETDPENGQPAVLAELAQPFRQSFSELTRRNVHRPLAVLINGEIRSIPVVQAPIDSGSLRIDPSPMADPARVRTQAEALAAGLNAWSLAGKLKLIKKEITAPR
jgi:preprotein translocase subunit SecD